MLAVFTLGKYMMTNEINQLDDDFELVAPDATPRLGWNPTEEVPEFVDKSIKVKTIQVPGVFVKTSFIPKGTLVVTRFFDKDHVAILGKGSVVVEDGETAVKYMAPAHAIFKQHTRYKISVLENTVMYSINEESL